VDFLQDPAAYCNVDFFVTEFQVTLRKIPVDFEFSGANIFHILLFPSEHQDRAASDSHCNECPAACWLQWNATSRYSPTRRRMRAGH
jgi:hypothetical protein